MLLKLAFLTLEMTNTPIDPADPKFKTPGQLIEALLEVNAWSKRVLSIVLEMDETAINKIISGKKAMNAEMALVFSEVFNIPAENFLALQKSYDLAKARYVALPDPGRTNRANLFGKLPIAEMIKRGWLNVDSVRDMPKVEAEITRFFGANSIDEIEVMPHAAKKTNVTRETTPTQLAWLYRVNQLASEMMVPRYSPQSVRAAERILHELLISADAIRKVPKILFEAGIRFLLVESLPGSKVDGVCMWLDDTKPVIALTLRFDRIDNFWFVLRHELEHVLQEHGKSGIAIDSDMDGSPSGDSPGIAEEEKIANEAAADFCVPQKTLKAFVSRKAPLITERDMLALAKMVSVHPGLVAGQLRRGTGRYDLFQNHLVKIRHIVRADGALVDGWGDVVPTGN